MRSTASALLALALVSCSSASSSPPSREPSPPAERTPPKRPTRAAPPTPESKEIARTLARVSELRGVQAMHPVPGVRLERNRLVNLVKEKALREYPPAAIRREGQLLQLLGFAPPSFDYLAETMSLLEAQLEGLYEPKDGTMYLAADIDGVEAEATLAHELVHALQDQHWDLKSRSSYRPGKGDETLALACLAEGDATSLMADYVIFGEGKSAIDMPDEALRALMESGLTKPSVANVPHVLRSSLIAPYTEGIVFVHGLRRLGGWEMVNRAWEQPPKTTEQVLHVDKWQGHEPALTVPPPSARALGEGFSREDEDTFGELGLALLFEEWIGASAARSLVTGWGGDRSGVFEKENEIAFAVHLQYDSAPIAERATAKLAPAVKKALGKAAVDTATSTCFERKTLGPLSFSRKGRDLVVTAGPARTDGSTYRSTSTCTAAKAWAEEILAQTL